MRTRQAKDGGPSEAYLMEVAMDLSRQADRLHAARVHVMYLDVLGFKEEVARDPEHVFEVMTGARRLALQMAQHRHPYHGNDGPHIEGFTRMNPPVTFSDSIFACTKDDSALALEQLCHYANTTFRHLILKGLASRGAISTGQVYWDDYAGVHLGKGITRAYELAESLDCIGIAVDPSISPARCLLGPFQFRTKGGGPVSLHAPGVNNRFGLSVDNVADCYQTMSRKARERGDVKVIAKYESSQQLVDGMVSSSASFDDDPPNVPTNQVPRAPEDPRAATKPATTR